MSMSIRLLLLILCFYALLYDAYALVFDGVTLLSLLTHWTFVPPTINSSWNPSDSNPCSWVGIQCDHAHNVVSIDLTDHGIIGQLGPEIGQLYHLQTLVLLSNGFTCTKKRFSSMHEEYQAFLMIRHRNLVAYKACLLGEDYGLFLCDYMENGNLHDILHEKNPPVPLAWNVRFKIAVGIAQGLQYLHHNRFPPIVHRDIKSMNILLDADMEPHISDFWAALIWYQRFVRVTVGYIAPESAHTLLPSRKSDVYSYGVVLLELITRKKAVLEDEEQVTTLVSWAKSMWVETRKIEKIVDSDLVSAFPNSAVLAKQVTRVLLLALSCTEGDPLNRPTVKEIVGFYHEGIFKLSCDDVVYGADVAVDVAP